MIKIFAFPNNFFVLKRCLVNTYEGAAIMIFFPLINMAIFIREKKNYHAQTATVHNYFKAIQCIFHPVAYHQIKLESKLITIVA